MEMKYPKQWIFYCPETEELIVCYSYAINHFLDNDYILLGEL